MPWTVAILTWIAATVGQGVIWLIHSVVSKYLFRALAVAAMAGAFWILFTIQYDIVHGLLTSAVGHVQASQSSLGVTLEFALCLIPSTLPEAITVLFAIMLQAVAVKWVRMVLFAKLA